MATAKRTKNDYIFEHRESRHLYVRFRDENGRRCVRSLGTTDYRKAEIIAWDKYIKPHKERLQAARPRLETVWVPQLQPGRKHTAPDGREIIATERELIYIGQDGSIIKTDPNGGYGFQLVSQAPLTIRGLAETFTKAEGPIFGDPIARVRAPTRTRDDVILQTYLDHGGKKNTGIHGHFRREAENVWALFKRLTDNKPLKECTRADGRLLVTHCQSEGLRSATIAKKIAWLNAAVNLAIKDGNFSSINPFAGIAPSGDEDKAERLPLSDDDIAATKRGLSGVDKSDQVLFRLLATTGMRLSEAFEIGRKVKTKSKVKKNGKWAEDEIEVTNSDMTENGVRYVIVGHKTKQSKRRVPLPAGMLPHLPKSINAPLFDGTPAAASKRLNRFLRDCGIIDARKVLHSLRHRAQDRMRAVECPQDIRWALLGHEDETIAEGYGSGFSVLQLKKWIDKIGY